MVKQSKTFVLAAEPKAPPPGLSLKISRFRSKILRYFYKKGLIGIDMTFDS